MPTPGYRAAGPRLLKKSTFTALKIACLRAGLPRLLGPVELLEGVCLLLPRERLGTIGELILATMRHGREYVRRRHCQPAYYHQWLRRQEGRSSGKAALIREHLPQKPLISLLLFLQEGEAPWLPLLVASMRGQLYPHWELLLVSPEGLPPQLAEPPAGTWPPDDRIHVFGAGDAARAWERATGDFIIFPHGRDLLAPTALLEVVRQVNRTPTAEIIYSDEDTIDAAGVRSEPFFKPGWSPDLALSLPYTGPLTAFRTSRVRRLGEVRPELRPATHYDVLLRLLTHIPAHRIQHIPHILYHRRRTAGRSGQAQAAAAVRQALQNHQERTAPDGEVRPGEAPGTFRLVRRLREPPGVSILIPFKDRVELLAQCLDSLFRHTDYPRWEVILMDNQSREPATLAYLEQAANNPRVRLQQYDQPFNFAAMNNWAARQARYPYLLFLNNDTQAIEASWLPAMAEHLERPEVGAVGAKLLFPDGTIQHGGLAVGGGGWLCGDYFRGTPDDDSAHILTRVVRNCSAVTAACLLTKKDLFEAVGGFDAAHLPVCYNDVDFCLKLRKRGYLIVWTPHARLYHHESASRGQIPRLADLERLAREQRAMEARWWPVIQEDPYYNPNLSRLFDGYAF